MSITAAEAKKIVLSSGKLFEETKERISKNIIETSQRGGERISCSAPVGIHFMIIDYFTEQGFKVMQNDNDNPMYLSFDWSETE